MMSLVDRSGCTVAMMCTIRLTESHAQRVACLQPRHSAPAAAAKGKARVGCRAILAGRRPLRHTYGLGLVCNTSSLPFVRCMTSIIAAGLGYNVTMRRSTSPDCFQIHVAVAIHWLGSCRLPSPNSPSSSIFTVPTIKRSLICQERFRSSLGASRISSACTLVTILSVAQSLRASSS